MTASIADVEAAAKEKWPNMDARVCEFPNHGGWFAYVPLTDPEHFACADTLDALLAKLGGQPMPFDPTKPVQLRNGGAAKVLEVAEGKIFGRCQFRNDGEWYGQSWNADGRIGTCAGGADLINIQPAPPKVIEIKRWFNVYSEDDASSHPSRAMADAKAAPERFCCAERTLTFTEGEGLETKAEGEA